MTWPTVAQAIYILWHDIHYFVRGTSAYFALDVRHGEDGLAVLERIAYEHFPTLCIKIVNFHGKPVVDAIFRIPCFNLEARTDKDGILYFLNEVPAGVDIFVSHNDYQDYNGRLERGTDGDYCETTITMEHNIAL